MDARDIRKHANDVLRLSRLLAPDTRIPVEARIAVDLNRFLDGIEADRSIDPKALTLGASVAAVLDRIAQAYQRYVHVVRRSHEEPPTNAEGVFEHRHTAGGPGHTLRHSR